MARCLWLVRHGQISEEYAGRYIGATDVPLSPEGLRRAAGLTAIKRLQAAEVCFCSPRLRARQTLQAFRAPAPDQVLMDDDLQEINFGAWEGKTFAEISEHQAALVDAWARWDQNFAFPAGEALADFAARIRRVAQRLAAHPAEKVLAVTHGGVIRGLLCFFLNLDLKNYLRFDVQHATLTTLELFPNNGAVLSGLNEKGTEV